MNLIGAAFQKNRRIYVHLVEDIFISMECLCFLELSNGLYLPESLTMCSSTLGKNSSWKHSRFHAEGLHYGLPFLRFLSGETKVGWAGIKLQFLYTNEHFGALSFFSKGM